jgi:hypothetical protein
MLLALMAMLALYAPTALAKDDDGYDDDFDDGGVAAPAQYDDVDGGGLMFSIPLNYGLSRADAADLSQVTFTILIQSLDSLDDDSRRGACLSTAARRHTWRLVERRHEGTGKG